MLARKGYGARRRGSRGPRGTARTGRPHARSGSRRPRCSTSGLETESDHPGSADTSVSPGRRGHRPGELSDRSLLTHPYSAKVGGPWERSHGSRRSTPPEPLMSLRRITSAPALLAPRRPLRALPSPALSPGPPPPRRRAGRRPRVTLPRHPLLRPPAHPGAVKQIKDLVRPGDLRTPSASRAWSPPRRPCGSTAARRPRSAGPSARPSRPRRGSTPSRCSSPTTSRSATAPSTRRAAPRHRRLPGLDPRPSPQASATARPT